MADKKFVEKESLEKYLKRTLPGVREEAISAPKTGNFEIDLLAPIEEKALFDLITEYLKRFDCEAEVIDGLGFKIIRDLVLSNVIVVSFSDRCKHIKVSVI